MVIRLSLTGISQPGTHVPEALGPRPGPEPVRARFVRPEPGRISLQGLKSDIKAYRVLGLARRSEQEREAGEVAARVRNRYNNSVYTASLDRTAGSKPASANMTRLPVIGEIAAGQYDVTVAFHDYDCMDKGVAIDRSLARGGVFALRVRGTSMSHVGIEPGDVVVIRPQNWADDGDFVVANYAEGDAGGAEGLATLKRYYKRKDHVFLQSATASTDPIRLFAGRHEGDRDPVRIQGVVTVVLKA